MRASNKNAVIGYGYGSGYGYSYGDGSGHGGGRLIFGERAHSVALTTAT